MPTVHPTPDVLNRLLTGTVTDAESRWVVHHLVARCDVCSRYPRGALDAIDAREPAGRYDAGFAIAMDRSASRLAAIRAEQLRGDDPLGQDPGHAAGAATGPHPRRPPVSHLGDHRALPRGRGQVQLARHPERPPRLPPRAGHRRAPAGARLPRRPALRPARPRPGRPRRRPAPRPAARRRQASRRTTSATALRRTAFRSHACTATSSPW